MIDVAKIIPTSSSINRFSMFKFHNRDPRLAFGSPTPFSKADQFPLKFANLLPGFNDRLRKHALALD